MVPDWKLLAPHRPLDPGAAAYIRPPDGTGERVAKWIAAGGSTVLLGGPVGVGKSTELAHAASQLQATHVACLVPLDRFANMRKITADEARSVITARVADLALRVLGIDLSDDLREVLRARNLVDARWMRGTTWALREASPEIVLDLTLREVARLSRQRRICLLVDGLEKCPEAVGREVFDAIAGAPDDVDLAVVVPWYAAFGPGSDQVVRSGEKLFSVRPPAVSGAEGRVGRDFLRGVLGRRLGMAPEFFDATTLIDAPPGVTDVVAPGPVALLVERASEQSGGCVRTFLQILADAGSYARLRRDADWPDEADIEDALADQRDSFRRILLPGDRDAILEADGTSGMELALDRKIRLMAHGVLLERLHGRDAVLEAHPLARAVLGMGEAANE